MAESLRLLGNVGPGRVLFTRNTLPAIGPVDHIPAVDDVIVRTHRGSAMAAYGRGTGARTVLAYETDGIDAISHLSWSIVVTGSAHLVTDPAELDNSRGRLRPWADPLTDLAVHIHPEVITGLRLTV
ncbi:pyridoxamine 5'-phosphate oxidase family protein [Streptomyces sp. NPDC050528]|uniref:pyridoxamine 5'-phosphate oxidase family protein n=1 Tax=Streptomyces sp. NPDC050528 TaxID=3365623 RepID=UPI0037A9B1F8